MIKGIILTVGIIYLIVETQLLDSVIRAVYPIVSQFPLGSLGLVSIGLAVLLFTVGKLANSLR
jgi:hypothetical protein